MRPHKQTTIKSVLLIAMASLVTFGCGESLGPDTPVSKPGQKETFTHETKARLTPVVQTYEAVGTIRPETETVVEAQVTAKIEKIPVTPGSTVTKGQLLLALDSRQLTSRLDQAVEGQRGAVAARKQAKQALVAAEAGFERAQSAYKRTQTFHTSDAATDQQLEEAKAAFLTAEAGVLRSREALAAAESQIRQAKERIKEARIALGYAELKAPEDGEVLKKMVEPGDLALPGKPLLVLRTSRQLILEAFVREGLITAVAPGDTLDVELTTLKRKVSATVKEIVPYADPKTRTFLVKAALPMVEGLYPGMYGKLMVPTGTTDVITLPQKAINRVGQLELVRVKREDTWERRYIQTGNTLGQNVEILSGLTPGETVGF